MHVAIIGAGPAGSLAAILLARAGVAATLIEQHTFPREKVCGECLSALGRSVLRRHAIEPPGIELCRTRLVTPDYEATLDLPSPMLGITRSRLDAMLLHQAERHGVAVLQPARAEAIDGASARVRFLPTNDLSTITPDWIIVADGRGALFGDRPELTGDLGIKTHFADVRLDTNAITLFSGDGCYGGVAPVESGRWNVAFSVPANRVKAAAGDVHAVFDAVRRSHRRLDASLKDSTRIGDWLASPLPRYGVRSDWPPRVIPIGNAACAIEPIGGEGMGMALRSAELAVAALLNGHVASLPRQYRRLWRGRSLFCRLGGVAFASERWASACVSLADAPAVARIGLALVGK